MGAIFARPARAGKVRAAAGQSLTLPPRIAHEDGVPGRLYSRSETGALIAPRGLRLSLVLWFVYITDCKC